jgi:uncharacterized protein involved in response to NO
MNPLLIFAGLWLALIALLWCLYLLIKDHVSRQESAPIYPLEWHRRDVKVLGPGPFDWSRDGSDVA